MPKPQILKSPTTHTVICGDAIHLSQEQDADSIDAIVTDPPYGLKFMDQFWDNGIPGIPFWEEFLRVAKPGAHLLAFGGTRTHHRLMCAIEDAGWKIRDVIMWVYGSGFPKSLDVSKAVTNNEPATDAAKQWDGWGTALKPAWEPIIVARKPLDGTVANNVLTHGTGAINVDGCRVETEDALGGGNNSATVSRAGKHEGWRRPWMDDPKSASDSAERSRASTAKSEQLGRFPANLIHDGSDEVLAGFPNTAPSSSKGSAARFFYCAKASKKDRGEGNKHPTVKPTSLMKYLVRLATPPGGTVLDPFTGSGSTGVSAKDEGFNFLGFELDPDHAAFAQSRIDRT